MPTDAPTPLATEDQFRRGAFADLATNLQSAALADILIEATRACESACSGRRLVPFTITETHRADGVDPDEYGDNSTSMPMDLPGTLGRSYANALGAGSLVRHVWLNQFARQYPDLWTYQVNSLTILRSIGGTQDVTISSLIGPEPDSGHLWFPIGTFLPIGSLIRVNYSGGYSTIPADLVRAGKSMAASIIIKELDPNLSSVHDPDLLRKEAESFLAPYMPH